MHKCSDAYVSVVTEDLLIFLQDTAPFLCGAIKGIAIRINKRCFRQFLGRDDIRGHAHAGITREYSQSLILRRIDSQGDISCFLIMDRYTEKGEEGDVI